MPRLVRPPLVALLAALAALLAPLGATAAGPAAVAGRPAAGAVQAIGLSPAGRVVPGRELREAVARRALHGGAEVVGMVTAGSEKAGQGGPAHVPATALAVVLLAGAVGWWVRRSVLARVPAGRTTGSRCGRGPPALACA